MKKTFLLFAILAYSSLGFSTEASDFFNEFGAVHTAIALSKVTTAKDLPAYLPMNKRDTDQYLRELKTGMMSGFVPPKVTMPSKTEIVIAALGESLKFDFREFSEGVLYIDTTKFKLDSKSTFYDFKAGVKKILQAKRKMAGLGRILLPEADAGVTDWLSSTVGAVTAFVQGGGTQNIKVSPGAYVADTLIQAYKDDATDAKRNSEIMHNEGAPTMTTLVFTCNGNVLASVQEVRVVFEGRSHQGSDTDSKMTFTPGKGFYYRSLECREGAETDLGGRVVKSGQGKACAKVGENIFSYYPMFRFPTIAAKCCAQEGCHERVSKALAEITKPLLTPEQPSKAEAGH